MWCPVISLLNTYPVLRGAAAAAVTDIVASPDPVNVMVVLVLEEPPETTAAALRAAVATVLYTAFTFGNRELGGAAAVK